jgi:hypothetical protein
MACRVWLWASVSESWCRLHTHYICIKKIRGPDRGSEYALSACALRCSRMAQDEQLGSVGGWVGSEACSHLFTKCSHLFRFVGVDRSGVGLVDIMCGVC